MTLDNTDQFVVSREDSLYAVEAQLLTTQLEDTDLMVVSRSGVPYKATGAEIKDSLGSPSINPGDNDVSLDPAALGGTGTEQDPYILRNGSANPFGGTTETTETISIVGQSPQANVIWTDNSIDAGTRFSQIVGITDTNGNWSGKLDYADIPNSTEDTVYVGKLQIGLVHYQWTVNQVNVIEQPTTVDSVNLIEADPEGDRFTSQSFVASSQVTDGVPTSVKTIDAHVDGTLSKLVQFDEPLESSSPTVITGSTWSSDVSTSGNITAGPRSLAFDGNVNTYLGCNADITWDTSAYPLSGNLTVTMYSNGVGSYVTVFHAGGTEVVYGPQSPGYKPFVFPYLINITEVVCSRNQPGADCRLNAFELNGQFIVNGQSINGTALTFANGTDMEGLAGGDTVTQTSNFTEPLESSTSTTAPTYTLGGATDPENAFDGDLNTVAYSFSTDGPLNFQVPDSGFYTPSDEIVFYTRGGTAYILVLYYVDGTDDTINIPNTGGDSFTSPISGTKNWNAFSFRQNGGSGNTLLYGVAINGGLLVSGGQITNLTFANGTDMSALAAGDAVSQPGDGIAGRTWSDDLTTPDGFQADKPKTLAFDGTTLFAVTTQTTYPVLWNTSAYPLTGRLVISAACGGILAYKADGSPDVVGAGDTFVQAIDCGEVSDITKIELQVTPSGFTYIQEITLDGEAFIDGQGFGTTSGTVGSITGTTATLSSSSGDWVNGTAVTTGDKTTTGAVSGVSGTTATLSSSSGSWANGVDVFGPEKTVVEENARLYCAFDSNGNVTDLLNSPQDPPYTTQDSNPGLTLTFPATFPSGQTPDDELPEGTTFTVEVSAENSSSTSGPVSATVQPELPGPPPPDRDPLLAGLTTLYTGNDTGQQIVNGIDLVNNAGLVWIKSRTEGYSHMLFDTLRDATEVLTSDNTDLSYSNPDSLTSFNANGFNVGSTLNVNGPTSQTNVAWTFGKAEDYFDVVEYTGNGTSQLIDHNLNADVGLLIVKNLESSWGWQVWHSSFDSQQYLQLNESFAVDTSADAWNSTVPTSSQFSVGALFNANESGKKFIAYLFAEDTPGVIKCGSLSTTGKVVTGFKPQWLLIKRTTSGGGGGVENWMIFDDKRPATSPVSGDIGDALFADENGTETQYGFFEFLDDGFDNQLFNTPCIYVAIAAPPPIPVAPEKLAGLTTLYNGNGTGQPIVNGIDLVNNDGLVWLKTRDVATGHTLYDTVKGRGSALVTNSTSKELTPASSDGLISFDNNGFTLGSNYAGENALNDSQVAWTFGKAEGYFDVVQFNNQGQDVPHSLGTKPGFIITKFPDETGVWICYHSSIGVENNLKLNSTEGTNTANFSDREPDASNFSLSADNWGTGNIIAYLFAEDNPGVIKCGTFQVNGTSANDIVDCGFKPQWLMIKDADGTTDWEITDSARGTYVQPSGPDGKALYANTNLVEQPGYISFVDNGFIHQRASSNVSTVIYIAIAAPPDTRSQTNEEFVESQAKFLTYDNRKQVKEGEEALDNREYLQEELEKKGLTKDQITKLFND